MAPDLQHAALHEHYERGEEADRLERSGAGRLEFERTQEIVLRHLPPPPATVADIGGGPGRYAVWLAGLGYRVVHRDIVPTHVDQVQAAAVAAGVAVDAAVGDARDLDLGDEAVHAVLLLGPLYHLPRRADRVRALREAGRIVRPGGPVFGAVISRWAARLDGMLRQRIYTKYPAAEQVVDTVERGGLLPPLVPGGFSAVTHRPGQLRGEFAAAGLAVADLVCVEGAGYLLDDLDARIADERDWQVVLDSARAHERVPELLGIGSHLIATGLRR
ncbi:MAG TPA: methyltransferase domain-containing protein [Streptosporangiaceae bacterium]|nr:methyltransferase domain-containing protein [Streptosporangiaceae bacterium]